MSGFTYTTLSGPDSSGDSYVSPAAINASGEVVGNYTNGSNANLGFIYDPTNNSYTTLSGPDSSGDTDITPTGISASGEVIGNYTNSSTVKVGFIYDPTNNSYTTLSGPDSSGDTAITGVGIDAAGEVVGNYYHGNTKFGFIYDPTNNSYTTLSGPDSSVDRDIDVTGVNASGEVIGYYTNSSTVQVGFVYDPTNGSYTTLSGPDSSGDGGIELTGINASGEVVGNYTNGSNANLGFIYDPTNNSYTTLSGPDSGGDMDIIPTGINASGDVAGYYYSNNVPSGFVYDPTTKSYVVVSGPDSLNGGPDGSGDNGAAAFGINDSGAIIGEYVDSRGQGVAFAADPACYCAGTLIQTPDGSAKVETLTIGDSVVTADGRTMPVRWIGRNTVSTRFADPLRVLPIRIKAGALGDSVPVRDLLVSADHAVLVEDILIQAGALVNGVSILREKNVPETFTYYHVELADHALILAEGAPAETFVDNISRMGFDNWAEHEALYGSDPLIVEMPYPRAQSHRQVPMKISRSLWHRACALIAAHTRAVAA
jgi:inosine/xanthosine triphosphate pyrophosphatase family protein